MLCLESRTDRSFVDRFEANVEDMLIDHAHCEKKAASTALQLIFRYPDNGPLVTEMCEIVEEEMEHFQAVLEILHDRHMRFGKQKPSAYAGRLYAHCRKGLEDDGFIDRMLICALIEARSCERFALLGEHLADDELRTFYAELFESEARHYSTYVKLALGSFSEERVRPRLKELARIEAEINATGEALPRLHT